MEFKEFIANKFTSRKFLVSVAGIVSGIAMILNGAHTEGTATIIATIIAYLAAEGYIDAKALKSTTEKIDEAVENLEFTDTEK